MLEKLKLQLVATDIVASPNKKSCTKSIGGLGHTFIPRAWIHTNLAWWAQKNSMMMTMQKSKQWVENPQKKFPFWSPLQATPQAYLRSKNQTQIDWKNGNDVAQQFK
mgnify:CR=1 FL=1